jgi:hypothetical protein
MRTCEYFGDSATNKLFGGGQEVDFQTRTCHSLSR